MVCHQRGPGGIEVKREYVLRKATNIFMTTPPCSIIKKEKVQVLNLRKEFTKSLTKHHQPSCMHL